MYGKRRIVITRLNRIILAGGGSYIQIGRFNKERNVLGRAWVSGRVLYVPNRFDSKLTEDNSMNFSFINAKALKEYLKEFYKQLL
jgi:hypothetical protein